jgi:integrase/recombinase XerD
MGLDEHIEEYLQYLKLERGLSDNTITSYRQDLTEFGKHFGNKRPNKATASAASVWVGHLSGLGRKPATVARKLSSLKQFFAYLTDNGHLKENPFATFSAPRIARYHPHYLSPGEVEKIIERVETDSLLGKRNRAIIELLYGSGLRISELIDLKISDIEAEAGFVKVLGKGGKQRLVPLGEYARVAIEIYLALRPRPPVEAAGDHLFLSRSGGKLSRVGLWKVIKRMVAAAGVAKPVSPHTFRHSFATHMLEGGADLRIVQEMLGHADISTTQIYTSIDRDYIVAEHRKYHPRELAGS